MAPIEQLQVADKVMKSSSNAPQIAPTAADDPSGVPTPAWMVKADKFLMVHNFIMPFTHGVALPYVLFGWQIYHGYWFTWRELLMTILFGYFKLVVAFTILHRFFAHKAFSASRPVAFFLGLVALTGGQKGPLWWASKHVRHHKFCENEADPHSASRFGYFYGFMGWTFHPKEWHIDWEFVHPQFKVWEMVLCESLTGVVSFGEQLFYYHHWGFRAAVMNYWATILAIYVTLFFNMYLHHDEDVDPAPMSNGKYRCRAHDKVPWSAKWILDFIGEMNHYDHHRYPRKALHPCAFLDVPYWLFIYPGEALGLFYDVNHTGRTLFAKKQL